MQIHQDKQNDYSRFLTWGIVILIVLFTSAIRVRLLGIPLERDEGEFAYMGQLILQGIPPYSLVYSMKLPGVYAAYALIVAIFGQTSSGIHLGLLLINALTIVAVFLLARRLFDPYAGLIACATYGLLSVSPTVLGTSAHATHFVVLPALCGILLILKASDTGKSNHMFWGGILLGIAFIMKQPGIFFIIFAWLYLFRRQFQAPHIVGKRFLKQSVFLLMGVVIPFTLTCLLLFWASVFDKFWFWTFTYAREYISEEPLSEGFTIFLFIVRRVIGPAFLLWMLAAIGLSTSLWDEKGRPHIFFLESFLVFSFLSMCPGLYFRNHYFVLFLPTVALLTGLAVSSMPRLLSKFNSKFIIQFTPILVFLVAFGYTVVKQKAFFFEMTPLQACRLMYGSNPFWESLEIARYIKAHTIKDDRIAVLGSEPQIYFYADRLSATGYIYTYGLMENQRYALQMQREMIKQIEAVQPEYLVFVKVTKSWSVSPNSEMLIFNWFDKYRQDYYDLTGIIDIIPSSQTVYRWEDEVRGYSPQSTNVVYVFRRKVNT
jgi:hypothetical protein